MSKLQKGEGGSEPSLSVQTFCVHTCLMGGGVSVSLDNVQSLVVFFFDGSPKRLYQFVKEVESEYSVLEYS